MRTASTHEVTQLLLAWREGDAGAGRSGRWQGLKARGRSKASVWQLWS